MGKKQAKGRCGGGGRSGGAAKSAAGGGRSGGGGGGAAVGAKAAELIAQAEALTEQAMVVPGAAGGALELYQRVLELEPSNTSVMDAAAVLLLEAGEAEAAAHLLVRSVELAPAEGSIKYMYLGQLQDGQEAVVAYERGIEVLGHERAAAAAGGGAPGAAERLRDIDVQLCRGCCSIAEALLVMGGDESAVWAQCEQALGAAQGHSPTSPEPYQGLANLYVSQGRGEEGIAALRRCAELTDPLESPYEFRIHTGKLFMELGQWPEAVAQFESLLQERDDDVELLYLLGIAQGLNADNKEAHDALVRAQELLEQLGEAADHTGALSAQVQAALEELEGLGGLDD